MGATSRQNAVATEVLAGLVTGSLVVFIEVSLAALIFSGPLSSYYGAGIGVMLLGTLTSLVIAGLLSKFDAVVCIAQDVPATILALFAAAFLGSAATASFESFASVVLIMGFASIVTGCLMWCFGHFNLGRFIRFLPYPVIGGFMAGTGWLLFVGGLSVINNGDTGASLLSLNTMQHWLPALIFAVALLYCTRNFSHPVVMPLLFAGATAAFVITVSVMHGGVTEGMKEAMSQGWLLGPLPAAELWRPVTFQVIQQADWQQLVLNSSLILTIFLISTVSLLLNISGLEIITKTDVDLNRELKTVGLSNLASGSVGCSPGYHMLSLSTLNHRLGAKTKLSIVIIAIVLVVTLIFGADLLSYTPRMIAAGFLLFLGLSFLTEWLYDGWHKLPRSDYALVCLIVAIIATVGLLQGVVIGVLIAVVLFVVAYTNTDVIRHTFTRDRYQSYIMRAPEHERMLEECGNGVYAIELQGFIFFGMAHQMLDKVKARINNIDNRGIRYLILDFRLVTGLDSSASYSFSRLRQITSLAGVSLSYSNISHSLRVQLVEGADTKQAMFFDDLDHAIAWIDEQTLNSRLTDEKISQPTTTKHYFQTALGLTDNELMVSDRLLRFMHFSEQKAGEVLLKEGDPVDRLFFIETGKVHIQTRLPDGAIKLLRVQTGGTVFGEIGMYTSSKATASVVVAETAQIFTLTQSALAKMEKEDPTLAINVHRLIAVVLGRKLTQANYALIALQK